MLGHCESAEHFYLLSRLKKLLFPKKNLLELPSYTATSLKNVFEMDLKKRLEGSFLPLCGQSHTDWPFARQAPVPSKASVPQMMCSDGKAGVQQSFLRLLAAEKFPAALQGNILRASSKESVKLELAGGRALYCQKSSEGKREGSRENRCGQ